MTVGGHADESSQTLPAEVRPIMPRIRSLKIGFFENEHLAQLSPHHRLLFAGLWLLADREGRLEDRPKRIEAVLFPYEAVDTPRLLHDLAAAGFIQRYEREGIKCILVSKFTAHQRPHPKEPKSQLPEPVSVEPRKETVVPWKDTASPGGLGDLGLGDLGLGGGSKNGAAPMAKPQIRQSGHTKSLIGTHHRCPEGTWSACERGICVPVKLYAEWRAQFSDADDASRAITAFVDRTVAGFPEGPIGDSPFDLWRASWRAVHASRAPIAANPNTKGAQSVANVQRALARLRAEGM